MYCKSICLLAGIVHQLEARERSGRYRPQTERGAVAERQSLVVVRRGGRQRRAGVAEHVVRVNGAAGRSPRRTECYPGSARESESPLVVPIAKLVGVAPARDDHRRACRAVRCGRAEEDVRRRAVGQRQSARHKCARSAGHSQRAAIGDAHGAADVGVAADVRQGASQRSRASRSTQLRCRWPSPTNCFPCRTIATYPRKQLRSCRRHRCCRSDWRTQPCQARSMKR